MSGPTRAGWRLLFATAIFLIAAWPPDRDRSLLLKLTNWAVDPGNRLPVLPAQLGYGMGDDLQAVEEHDAQVRLYDHMYAEGGLTRARLQLKVARDPFNPSTERQVLLLIGVVVGFLTIRKDERR